MLSLDALVVHEEARAALVQVFKVSGELGSAACRYLGLFRPAQRELTLDRVARILGEIASGIEAGSIARHGKTYSAPSEAWIWAMRQAVDARDAGRLKTPLKSHGWLYEAITGWSGFTAPAGGGPTTPRAASQTMQALAALEGRIHGS